MNPISRRRTLAATAAVRGLPAVGGEVFYGCHGSPLM
jgi:hypothetical protein